MINAVDPSLTQTASDSAIFDGLGGDAFLTLLVTQLRYQDPLSPTDPSSMLQQTSQFANVEAIQKLNTLQTQSLGFTQFQAATTMIGREVTVNDGDLGQFTDVVTGVDATPTGPRLQLASGETVDVTDVTAVNTVPPPTTTPAAPESDLTEGSSPS